jgi:hypothetical protein
MTAYRYSYTGPLELYDLGRYAYHVLYASPELQAELLAQQRPRVRISGELEGIPVNLAWQPSGDGRLYLIVSDELRRARNLLAGDPVTVQFNIADPDAVVVPPELAQVLEQDPLYEHLWGELTPGRRRAFAHLIASAKGSATRARRLQEVLGHLEHNTFPQPRRTRASRPTEDE